MSLTCPEPDLQELVECPPKLLSSLRESKILAYHRLQKIKVAVKQGPTEKLRENIARLEKVHTSSLSPEDREEVAFVQALCGYDDLAERLQYIQQSGKEKAPSAQSSRSQSAPTLVQDTRHHFHPTSDSKKKSPAF